MAHNEHIGIGCRLCDESFKDSYIIIVEVVFRLISGVKGCVPKCDRWEVVITKPHLIDLVTLRHG